MGIAEIKYHIKNLLKTLRHILSGRRNSISAHSEFSDLFGLPADILNNTLMVSFCNTNIPLPVVNYQKKVFQLFNLPLVQVIENIPHALFMERILRESKADYIIFFDIDAIPLRKESVYILLEELQSGYSLAGAVQTANQFDSGRNSYIGPFFMGIHKSVYSTLGFPLLSESDENDVAGVLTKLALLKNLRIKYWVPTEVELPEWNLYRLGRFGLGTTYNGLVYHAFQIRDGNHFRFIKKCKKVLDFYKS